MHARWDKGPQESIVAIEAHFRGALLGFGRTLACHERKYRNIFEIPVKERKED